MNSPKKSKITLPSLQPEPIPKSFRSKSNPALSLESFSLKCPYLPKAQANETFLPYFSSMKDFIPKTTRHNEVSGSPFLINQKFFKVKPTNPDESKSNDMKTKRKLKPLGKAISWHMVKKINEKETLISKLESHHRYESLFGSENFQSDVYIKHFLSKLHQIKSPSEKKKTPIVNCLNNNGLKYITEDDFNCFIADFYKKKIVKCQSLMRIFEGKNHQIIINNIGKYIYNNLFSPIDANLSCFEYLENIHKNLEITNQDFDTYKGLFLISLRENGYPESEIQIFSVRLENFRQHIVKKLKYDDITCNKTIDFSQYIRKITDTVKENGILCQFFNNISDEDSINHHKKLFNYICNVSSNYNNDTKKEEFMKAVHKKIGLDWKHCFEMKNIFINNLIDGKKLSFPVDLDRFMTQIHYFHKFILPSPNQYQPDHQTYSIDMQLFISLFCHSLNKQKTLAKVFGSWPILRLQEHCKYLVEFLINSPKNPYKLCDLTPTHCGAFISGNEFNIVLNVFYSILTQMKCKKKEIDNLLIDFERTRYCISREKRLMEKIDSNVIPTDVVDTYIENLYAYMFGCPETKQFFINSDIEYVKYKQKLFYIKLFNCGIDSIDLVDLKAIHYKLGIKNSHFEAFIQFTEESLQEIKIEKCFIKLMLDKIKFLKDSVCSESE